MEDLAPPNETSEQRDIRLHKDVAAFSYIWIMSVIIYALRKDSPFVRHHSRQAVILFFLSIPTYIIPFVGQYLIFFVIAGMLYGFVTAAQGQMVDIPVIGVFAKGKLTIADISKGLSGAWHKLLSLFRQATHKDPASAPKPPAPPSPPTQS